MADVDEPVPPAGKPADAAPPKHRTLISTLIAVGFVAVAALVPLLSNHSSNAAIAGQLRTAIVQHYRLLPGDVEQSWRDLTPDYQHYVGGMAGYQAFWRPVSKIALHDLSASAPGSAVVTIDYYYRAGGIEVERTAFTLVKQGDTWKIDKSSVVNHHIEAG